MYVHCGSVTSATTLIREKGVHGVHAVVVLTSGYQSRSPSNHHVYSFARTSMPDNPVAKELKSYWLDESDSSKNPKHSIERSIMSGCEVTNLPHKCVVHRVPLSSPLMKTWGISRMIHVIVPRLPTSTSDRNRFIKNVYATVVQASSAFSVKGSNPLLIFGLPGTTSGHATRLYMRNAIEVMSDTTRWMKYQVDSIMFVKDQELISMAQDEYRTLYMHGYYLTVKRSDSEEEETEGSDEKEEEDDVGRVDEKDSSKYRRLTD